MTSLPTHHMTPEKTWDSWTVQQRVEWLATEVMRWELHNGVWHKRNNDGLDSLSATAGKSWNPITDWNHWREVELKLMEEGEDGLSSWLYEMFSNQWWNERELPWQSYERYMSADLPTRARALFLAYHSLQ